MKFKYALALLCILSTISTMGYLLSISNEALSIRLFMDDAYYYYQVAYNIAHGYGSTFDRIHPTNGYHPLWLIIAVPVYLLVSNKDLALLIFVFLQCLLFWIGAYNGIRAVTHSLITSSLVEVAALMSTFFLLVATPVFSKMFLGGLESALYWATIMLAFNLYQKVLSNPKQEKFEWLYGGALGLVFLSRIDGLILTISWLGCAMMMYIQEPHQSWGSFLRWFTQKVTRVLIPVALVVLLYFFWNYSHYGHLLTTSGTVKFTPSLNPRWLAFSSLLFVFWLMFLWLSSRMRWLHLYPLIPFISYPLLYFALLLLLSPGQVFRIWYHVPTVVAIWLLFSVVLAYLPPAILSVRFFKKFEQQLKIMVSVGGLVLVLAGFVTLQNWMGESRFVKWTRVHTATLWLADYAQSDDVIASFDGGRVGYTLPQRTINLDGLANSYDFQDVVKYRTLWGYLIDNKVRYIINHVNSGEAGLVDRLKPLDPQAPWESQTRVIYDDLFDDPREGRRRVQVIEILP